MTPTDFPLPRKMLPKLPGNRETLVSAKRMMERLLEHTVREFEQLSYTRDGVVDTRQWQALSRSQASQNGQHDPEVKVYSEREYGKTSSDLICMMQSDGADKDSTFAALPPSAVVVSGRAPGQVESIMYALGGAHTQDGLALFAGFMYDDIADCGVLHNLERDEKDHEGSCRFLGYKYVVKRRVASSAKLLRHRHMVYLEFTGYTQSSNGERLGFHIEHSVDVPGFPDLYDRSSSRVLQSVRYIFRQKSERIMEIYMLGNLQLAGVRNVGGVGVGGSNGTGGGDLFSICKLQQCAETRRLTSLVNRRRESIELLQQPSNHTTECFLCHRTKRFFSGSMLAECEVCGEIVCSKCRNDKKIFIRDGLLGKFRRAQTCKSCVLTTSAGYATPSPMHMSASQLLTKSRGSGKTSIGSGSLCGRGHLDSSSSIDSSIDARSECSTASRGESELHSHRQGPVHTFSDVAEEDFGGSRRLQEPSQPRRSPTIKREPEIVSIPSARARSRTLSSNSSASSDDSNSGRDGRRGIYLTPPNPSQVYEEGQQRRREAGRHHRRERHHHQLESRELHVHRRPNHTHQATGQLVACRDNQHRQLAQTAPDHSDLPANELAISHSNSYSGPSSAIASETAFSASGLGLQRTVSAPDNSRRADLMVQMMELNMKAENTYNATQRNGDFLKHQIRTRQW